VTAPAPVDVLARPTTPSRIDRLTIDRRRAAQGMVPDVLQRLPGVTLQDEQGNRFPAEPDHARLHQLAGDRAASGVERLPRRRPAQRADRRRG